MKRLLLAIGLFALLASSASALGLADLTLNGEVRNRGFYLSNYLGKENPDNYILSRALLDLGLQATPEAFCGLTVGAVRIWGTNNTLYQVEEPGAIQSVIPEIYNAYLKVNVQEGLALTVGRQYAGEKDDAFFYYGPARGRFLGVTSLDALRADLLLSPVKIYALAGKKNESDTAKTQWGVGEDEDQDILALGACSTELVENQKFTLDLYQRRIGQQAGWAQSDNLYLVVARAIGALPANLEYDVMVGVNAGSNRVADPYTGWLARVIGYANLNDLPYTDAKVTLGYVTVSGDNNTSDGRDNNFHRLSRDCFYNMALIVYELLNDVAPENVSNVNIPFAGLDLVPKALEGKLKIKSMYSYLSIPAYLTVAGHEVRDKGSEIDLRCEYSVSDNVMIELIGARFWPGELFQAVYHSEMPYDQLTLDVTLTF